MAKNSKKKPSRPKRVLAIYQKSNECLNLVKTSKIKP